MLKHTCRSSFRLHLELLSAYCEGSEFCHLLIFNKQMTDDLRGVRLSSSEAKFIRDGIQQGMRSDGRSLLDFRHLQLRLSVLPQANGSCRLRSKYSNNDVLCGVKLELAHTKEKPIECNVELGALARTDLFGPVEASIRAEKRGVELADNISAWLERRLQLPTLPNEKYRWVCQVDFTVFGDGGNLLEMLYIACYCALKDTRIPDLTVNEDGSDFDVNPEFNASHKLDLSELSLPSSCWIIANRCVIDPTAEEEVCATATVMVEYADDSGLLRVSKNGLGVIDSGIYFEAVDVAKNMCKRLLELVNSEVQYLEKHSTNLGEIIFDDSSRWNGV